VVPVMQLAIYQLQWCLIII